MLSLHMFMRVLSPNKSGDNNDNQDKACLLACYDEVINYIVVIGSCAFTTSKYIMHLTYLDMKNSV